MWTQGIHVHPCRDPILVCPWEQGTVLYSSTPAWGDRELWTPLWGAECAHWSAVAGERLPHTATLVSLIHQPWQAAAVCIPESITIFFPLQPCYWNCTLASSNSLVIFYNIFPGTCSTCLKSVLNLEAESCNKEDPKCTPKIY